MLGVHVLFREPTSHTVMWEFLPPQHVVRPLIAALHARALVAPMNALH